MGESEEGKKNEVSLSELFVSSPTYNDPHEKRENSPRISSSSPPFESYSSPKFTSLNPFLIPPTPEEGFGALEYPSCPFQIELAALASPVSPRGASVAA